MDEQADNSRPLSRLLPRLWPRLWTHKSCGHYRRNTKSLVFDLYPHPLLGFPGGSVVKNLPANAGDAGDTCSLPGSGRFPKEGNGNPLQCSYLGNPVGRGAWRATAHWRAHSQTWLERRSMRACRRSPQLNSRSSTLVDSHFSKCVMLILPLQFGS